MYTTTIEDLKHSLLSSLKTKNIYIRYGIPEKIVPDIIAEEWTAFLTNDVERRQRALEAEIGNDPRTGAFTRFPVSDVESGKLLYADLYKELTDRDFLPGSIKEDKDLDNNRQIHLLIYRRYIYN